MGPSKKSTPKEKPSSKNQKAKSSAMKEKKTHTPKASTLKTKSMKRSGSKERQKSEKREPEPHGGNGSDFVQGHNLLVEKVYAIILICKISEFFSNLFPLIRLESFRPARLKLLGRD